MSIMSKTKKGKKIKCKDERNHLERDHPLKKNNNNNSEMLESEN